MTLFHDERGAISAARVFLASVLTYEALYLPLARHDASIGVVLTFFTALNTGLVVWAAGPRVAQYLGPQAGRMVQGVADAIRRRREDGREFGAEAT